jgi:hypothetical protein
MRIIDSPLGEGLTTTVPKIKQVHNTLPQYISLKKDFVFTVPDTARQAKVLRPFYIRVEQLEKEFVVSSEISDVFEVGGTLKEAVLCYLYSLAEELIWLQERKDSLSTHMLKDLKKLQFYLDLV